MPQNDPARPDPTVRPKNEPQKQQFYYVIDEKMSDLFNLH